jgi:hypothetical protein
MRGVFMKKWIASATAITMTLSSVVHADLPPSTTVVAEQTGQQEQSMSPSEQQAQSAAVESDEPATNADASALDEPQDEPVVAEVGKASSDGAAEAARRRTWQRVGIAVAAVVVATVALILVSKSPGHK